MWSAFQIVRHDLKYFGVSKTLYDVLVRAVNMLVVFKTLMVLKVNSVDPQFLTIGKEFQARFLSYSEMADLQAKPDFEVSESFLNGVRRKGDACFGVFQGPKLVSFCWYSTQPTETSDGLMIAVPPDHVYLYKAFTCQENRGARLLAFGASRGLHEYLGRGFTTVALYIESNNFSSLKAFSRMGADLIGRLWVIKLLGGTIIYASGGLRRSNVTFTKYAPAMLSHPVQHNGLI